jgi:hypothetical protein
LFPQPWVKVLIYATGVFSSRKLAKRLDEDVARTMLMYVAGRVPERAQRLDRNRAALEPFDLALV